MTTLRSLADLAARVGGEETEVVALVPAGEDPHFVVPNDQMITTLKWADLVIHAGAGYEEGWFPAVAAAAGVSKLQAGNYGNFAASKLVTLVEVPEKPDRAMRDLHPAGNPHYLLDPRNGVKVALGIAEMLARMAPPRAAGFRGRANAYAKELEARILKWEKALKPLAGTRFVGYHASWPYFASWVGWSGAGVIEPKPGIPPSPEDLSRIGAAAKTAEKKISFVLLETHHPTGAAEQLASTLKARKLILPTEPGAAKGVVTYIGVFDAIAKAITAGSSAEASKQGKPKAKESEAPRSTPR